MKILKLFSLLLMGAALFACDSSDDNEGDWSKAREFGGVTRVGAVSFQIGDNVYVGLGYDGNRTYGDKEMRDFWKFRNNNWVKVDSFPGLGRFGAVAFVVDGKAYVGTGYRPQRSITVAGGAVDGSDTVIIQEKKYFSDFYVFDGETETWQKDSLSGEFTFPGQGREHAVAFAVGGNGFVGTGAIDANTVTSDFFKFNPQTGWTTTDFPGDSRRGASAFVINDMAIVCAGAGTGNSGYKYDVLKYNSKEDKWSSCNPIMNRSDHSFDDDYNKIQRAYAISFASSLDAGDGIPRGYLACGAGAYNRTCWEYNITKDRWYDVTSLPSAMTTPRVSAVGFALNGYGYVTTGGSSIETAMYQDSWRFVPGVEEDDDNDYSIVDQY